MPLTWSFPLPRLYSYVVDRDYGFAPNPFHGYCTLATCKPVIRRVAQVGDWIVGTGSAYRNRTGHIVFAMCVSEAMTFQEYWEDSRFRAKRPNLRGSLKQAFGDNIYHKEQETGLWLQEDSHHCYDDGTPNLENVANDTQTDRVLVGENFIYFGGSGPKIPEFHGVDICKRGQAHKSRFPGHVFSAFVEWQTAYEERGFSGRPLRWL